MERYRPQFHKTEISPGRPPHILIIGAGFAGLSAAKILCRTKADITILDKHNHHLFQPLLYQVATAALSPADIASPIRSIFRKNKNVTVLLGEATDLDLENRCVKSSDKQINYDYLIIATGSEVGYFGKDEWSRHSLGLKSIHDATHIRQQLLLAFEKAESCDDVLLQKKYLNFVLVGGGPTGVEMAGAIAELARAEMAFDFRKINPKEARIILIEAGPNLLPGYPEILSNYAAKTLERMGVEVHRNTLVKEVRAECVITDKESIQTSTIIWCAGVKPTSITAKLDISQHYKGRVPVKSDLSIPEYREVFVLGDACHFIGSNDKPLPGLASVAKQQGKYAGSTIAARITGKEDMPPFQYKNYGMLATIGRSAAVASFNSLRFKGLFAWLLWCFVHIYFLIGFRNRLVVSLNWIWAWLTYGRTARLITK